MAAYISQVWTGWITEAIPEIVPGIGAKFLAGKKYWVPIVMFFVAAYLWVKSFNLTSNYLTGAQNADGTAKIVGMLMVLLFVPLFGVVGALLGTVLATKERGWLFENIRQGAARPALLFLLVHAAANQGIWIHAFLA